MKGTHHTVLEQPWSVSRHDLSAEGLRRQEALFALSNGSMGVRGCLAEIPNGNMKGVFLGGVFDRSASPTPDMVNLPCFLQLDIVFEGERFGVDDCEVLDHVRTLDLKAGRLLRDSRLKTSSGRILRWRSTRILSIADTHLLAEAHTLTPENFSGTLNLTQHLDADTRTIDTWKDLPVDHYAVGELGENDAHVLYASLRLNDSRRPVCSASMLSVPQGNHCKTNVQPRHVSACWAVACHQGTPLVLHRYATAQSYLQNPDPEGLRQETLNYLADRAAAGFESIQAAQGHAMAARWRVADIEIEGDARLQALLRFNLFELIQAGPRHEARVSIGARGLTGEQYRGHVFWDTDLFMLPFYVFEDPVSARNMLRYRYHTLDGARRFSAANYTRGARFAVQTADTGDDAGPTYDVDTPHAPERTGKLGEPFRGRLRVPWLTREEIQVNGCIAYGVWCYYHATEDRDFLMDYGLELLVEIARYWCSRMEWVADNARYELLGVTGGDEMHIHADNNAYT
ncbi:MAG: glycoside hydrolase family 65 protein, partial [Phycisphaerae bacterium]|nr:glycoside hydrolase family 65 protein [Phycisphaerae bacterium]